MGLNTVDQSFDFIRLRNLANLSATLFVHSAELRCGTSKKKSFDTLIKAVSDRKIQAMAYEDAMRSDYSLIIPEQEPEPTEPPQPKPPCALRHFTDNKIVQFLRYNSRDGVNGNFQVAQLQRFLNEIGLEAGVADGIFGTNTKLAVIGFQISNNLDADGIMGPNTRAGMNAYCD